MVFCSRGGCFIPGPRHGARVQMSTGPPKMIQSETWFTWAVDDPKNSDLEDESTWHAFVLRWQAKVGVVE